MGKQTLPPPDGFAAVAVEFGVKPLAARYRVSLPTMRRWLTVLTVEQEAARAAKIKVDMRARALVAAAGASKAARSRTPSTKPLLITRFGDALAETGDVLRSAELCRITDGTARKLFAIMCRQLGWQAA